LIHQSDQFGNAGGGHDGGPLSRRGHGFSPGSAVGLAAAVVRWRRYPRHPSSGRDTEVARPLHSRDRATAWSGLAYSITDNYRPISRTPPSPWSGPSGVGQRSRCPTARWGGGGHGARPGDRSRDRRAGCHPLAETV